MEQDENTKQKNPENHDQYNFSEKQNDTPVPFGDADNVQRIDKDLDIKNFFYFSNNEFNNKKGQKFGYMGVRGANYSVAAQDFFIAITALAVVTGVGLPKPSLVGPGKHYIIKDEVGGAATTNITVRSEGEATIDGSSTSVINTNYGAKEYYTNGVNWFTF